MVGILLISIVVFLIVLELDLLVYGLRQAKGQFGLISGAERVDVVLTGNTISDSIRYKLQLIQRVKQFAYRELGMDTTEIYESVNLEGKYTMYVVTGSEKFRLKPFLWKFPIVGSVPYKGFFDLQPALRERDKLKDAGYDAGIRTAGGWSTLGWFENPLMREMLNRSEGDLCNLILHEMAHETIYINNESELNENLATFIGDAGTLLYLKEEFGEESAEYLDYVFDEEDQIKYAMHFIRGAEKLDSLYAGFESLESDSVREKRKNTMIKEVVQSLDTLQFHDPEKFTKTFSNVLPNNTYFLSFLRYRSSQEKYYEQLESEYEGDLKRYIDYLRTEFMD